MKKIFLLFLFGITLSCNSNNISDKNQKAENNNELSGAEIVLELEKMNFFDLTDSSELEITKNEIVKLKDKLNFFSGTLRGVSMDFTDNRFFAIDCEELFEIGGLTEYLKIVKPTFEKLDLKLEFKNEKSHNTENYWKHTIEINNREYKAFDTNFSEANWEIAYVNFIEILNDQLKKQNSNNRFYPIRCGNDGEMVLLTTEQFEFVKANYPKNFDHPQELETWKRKIGL